MRKLEFKNKEQEMLFENNKGFAISLAIEWNKKCEINEEELKSYALESLCIAAIKYNKEKCDKFINYAAIVINTNIKRELKRRNTQKKIAEKENKSLEDYKNNAVVPGDESSYKTLLLAIEKILDELPDIQKRVIKEYLIERKTLNELAHELSVSMRTIHKWTIKGREMLREKLTY